MCIARMYNATVSFMVRYIQNSCWPEKICGIKKSRSDRNINVKQSGSAHRRKMQIINRFVGHQLISYLLPLHLHEPPLPCCGHTAEAAPVATRGSWIWATLTFGSLCRRSTNRWREQVLVSIQRPWRRADEIGDGWAWPFGGHGWGWQSTC
jgi:hypothetical protein